ncbi:hypothetical protein SERLA73DRAFT_180416 [Serpula lacrymans var. lacrymans S7.3]|uniref:Uncharacterized protein n=2 Tax=Serpula lacrymans var. lacrymans TaxID=341189 RepID=F8PUK1_SERL3|nr:uncharacterized protein SERLADRAFT_466015 [Serpula lacrymans var. lacrymans S7.9]EGO00036.1 hypothetical protein SERLA73DRAFT_180416 [Serpula lacrymans var. lacrymans S7.3]EGO25605.1 hypothetical protein SERLADRAFT_466015 [Serpula lacrymans var. lacrymans S7.9]
MEVMSVIGNTATVIQRDTDIFYDTEVLAVIQRLKSKESGLVTSTVWGWCGNKCHCGDREEKKLIDLAKRYGTSLVTIHQLHEPQELVHALGGKLAIRQGTRLHWSSDNTAMHVVRSARGLIMIDEVDLNLKSLCSGFSFCLTVLDNIYVWYGRGSRADERKAAMEYAQRFAAKGSTVIELSEGEGDKKDEMFWMILGDGDYAQADYWKWRSSSLTEECRCWKVDIGNTDSVICPVPSLSSEILPQEAVYIMDCIWEFFVLVGREARAKRQDIKLAINTAMDMSSHIAASKPFTPPIHVLVIPTQLPLDLQIAFRDISENTLNSSHVPDHMNILSTTDAIEHLCRSSWEKSALKDHTMLPLGLDSFHIPD